MDETWQMISTFKTDGDKESFEHCKLILGPKMAYFCTPKLCFWLIWDNWRYRYTFTISKMDRTWHTRSTFRAGEDKNSFKHSWLILRPKCPIFAPKTAMLAAFGINEGISILFYNPIWMKLGILNQLLRLKKIKTVSYTSDSFWGQKWPIFAPNPVFLG